MNQKKIKDCKHGDNNNCCYPTMLVQLPSSCIMYSLFSEETVIGCKIDL